MRPCSEATLEDTPLHACAYVRVTKYVLRQRTLASRMREMPHPCRARERLGGE